MAVWSLELGMQPRWHGHAPFSPNPPSNRYGKPHFEHCVCPLTWAPCNPNHIMMLCAWPHALLWAADDRWGSIPLFLLCLALMMIGLCRVFLYMNLFCRIGLTSRGALAIWPQLVLFGLPMNVLILSNMSMPMMHKMRSNMANMPDRFYMKHLNPFKICLLHLWKRTSLKAKNSLRKSPCVAGTFTIDGSLNGLFQEILSFMAIGDFGPLTFWACGLIKWIEMKMLHLLWCFQILLVVVPSILFSMMCW